MSGRCAQNDDISQGRAAADGSSAKYRASLMIDFVDWRKTAEGSLAHDIRSG